MMKSRNITLFRLGLLLGLSALSFNTVAQARIGESASALERRLFSSGAIKYRDDAILENRSKGMPYTKFLQYMPGSVNVSIYFKTHDGRKPKSSEMESNRMKAGWDLHVVYVDGKSVLEVYKRSQGMSEFEFNQLMALQSSGGWQKVEKKQPAPGEDGPPPSAFGHTMESRDGSIRGKRLGGDAVLFVTPQVDQGLAVAELRDLQNLAPLSIRGF